MANVNGEIKPKKGGGGGMYVYKFDTGASRQKSLQEPEKKKGFHSGISWGLRRSKTVREVVHHNHHHQDNGSRVSNKNPTDYNDVKKEIGELARKSASSSAAYRKSVSHSEVNVASVAAFLQVKVLVTDMPGFMQVHAFRCARATYDSLEKFSSKHMAYNIKKEFDKVYGPAWHCIVGSSFGSFLTHATGCFLYFSMEKLNILVFKTKVQRSPQD